MNIYRLRNKRGEVKFMQASSMMEALELSGGSYRITGWVQNDLKDNVFTHYGILNRLDAEIDKLVRDLGITLPPKLMFERSKNK